MKYKEHDVVSLTVDLTVDGTLIPKGTSGTVVSVYRHGSMCAAYEVEFIIGKSSFVETVYVNQLEAKA